jgi:glycerol-3-phosphate dehydrogenase
MAGINNYRIYPCRGDYFKLKSAAKYRHLIYPVKSKNGSGLGIHLTIDMAGAYRLGPDAEYVEAKDQFPSAEHKLSVFKRAAENILGPLSDDQLAYDTCGIRPKLRAPDGAQERDFVLSMDLPGFVNLVGIESPGLTSALALAERVVTLLA